MAERQILSVSQLTRLIRGIVEAEDFLYDVWVGGEISNLTRHSSGHIYFCLKDHGALIRCVIWNDNARKLSFKLEEGMSLVSRGRISVYERQGQYQLVVTEATPAGVGALYVAYEQLKKRLEAEGLFDKAHKKAIPQYPKKIAILTSRTAAALRDMITIARRRMSSVDLLLVPTVMQGDGSEASVVNSLETADSLSDVDIIVLGRGGGSFEDLNCFNSEAIVRAIFGCKTPVVSAIGHETDFTLADFVADLRAPTPSAAMELIIPDINEQSRRIKAMSDSIQGSINADLTKKRSQLDLLMTAAYLKHPERFVQERWQALDNVEQRLISVFANNISQHKSKLGETAAKLEALSPLNVLTRGYSVLRDSKGKVIKRVSDAQAGDKTETYVSDGRIISEIKEIKEGWV